MSRRFFHTCRSLFVPQHRFLNLEPRAGGHVDTCTRNSAKMSQFSTDAAVSLEKEVDTATKPRRTRHEDVDSVYEIEKIVDWIRTNDFHKVCLQFPDHLLDDSTEVALRLQQILNETVYVLADTSYGSCCVDYVAAAHVEADAIVHFGPICFSSSAGTIPNLNIYEKSPLDVAKLKASYLELFGGEENPVIVVDTPYLHLLNEISANFPQNTIQPIDCGLKLDDAAVVFIGGNNRKLPNLKFNHKPKSLYYLDENSPPGLVNYEQDEKMLRRRYYLIEKIKDSNTVGIVIGTLGVKNYLTVIERIKKLVRSHGKKYYLISVGKPTVAKLANFPEIDVYVIITCALNEIYDSRDFYKPIVTPYDVEVALNPGADGLGFTYDFSNFVANPIADVVEQEGDISLITGKVRHSGDVAAEGGTEVALKTGGALALNSSYGAGYLAGRSWKGLEQNLGESEVKSAEEGRKGIAQGYSNEPDTQ